MTVFIPGSGLAFSLVEGQLFLSSGRSGLAGWLPTRFNPEGMTVFMQLQHCFARGLVAVRRAPAGEKRRVFQSESKRFKHFLAQRRLSRHRADYRRSLRQMGRGTGHRWLLVTTWPGWE